jgi:dienelactone hydrolase
MTQAQKLVVAVAAAMLSWTSSAHAGPSIADKCEAAKLKEAGKACACRLGVAAKALSKGITPDFSKCASKLADAFTKAEVKGGGACPSSGEEPTVDGRLVALVTDVSTALQAGSASGEAAVKCASAKLKATGKKCACMHQVQSVAALKGTVPDFTKCDAKLTSAFAKAEASAGGACPTMTDAEALCDVVGGTFGEVEADIANLGTAAFAESGRYGVGLRTITFVDSSRPTAANGTYPGAPQRTLVTDVWYPTDDMSTLQVPNAPFAAGVGPLPLIVRAHGFSGFRNDSLYLLRHLASHGYVVVAPDFPLSNLAAPGGPTIADVGEQALDLRFLIDTMTTANANSASPFFGHIDTDTIGAIGHSLGGATVLLATYHATLRDPRIDATVALSPLGCFILDGFFDSASVPLMIEGGTVDLITPYASNHLAPYGYANASKYLVEFAGGTHLGFADRLLFGKLEDGDEVVGCPLFVPPGAPRPVTLNTGLPPDFLGGPAAFIDPSGSQCQPICPLPPASFMLHARQNTLAKAASLAFLEAKLRGSIAGRRMITGKIDTENTDTALFFEE